jgi:hypothetical protein
VCWCTVCLRLLWLSFAFLACGVIQNSYFW